MRLALAVLAAGEGRRFRESGGATPKVLAEVRGRRLVDVALDEARGAGVGPVAVVVGASAVDGVPTGVTVLTNDRWAEGIATSLATAVGWADGQRADALLVGLADQPGVRSEAWRAVAAAPAEVDLAVAVYAGGRGHPVRLHRRVWARLPVTGDAGARALWRAQPDLVHEVPCEGDPRDVDTPADLARWAGGG